MVLGPYIALCESQYSMLRNAVVPPRSGRQLWITAPGGTEAYDAGQIVTVSYETAGDWSPADRIWGLRFCRDNNRTQLAMVAKRVRDPSRTIMAKTAATPNRTA